MVGKFVNFGGPSIFGGTGNIPDNLTDASGTVDAVEDTLAKAKQAFLQGDYPKALQDFMDISDGCPRANYFLGLMYQENLGTKVDNAVAKDYWQRGQQAGDKLCKICLLDKDDFLDSYDDEDDVEENLSDELKDSFFAFQFAKLCDAYGSSGLDADEIKRYFYESAEEHNALAYYELYKFYRSVVK